MKSIPRTIGEALAWGRSFLVGKTASSALDAAVLLAAVTGRPTEYAYLHPESPIGEAEYARYVELLGRRASGEPVAYLRGFKEFAGFSFKVDRRAFIPRPETELVLETGATLVRNVGKDRAQGTIADVCCGSGALGLSFLKWFPKWSAILTDISPDALELARENAGSLGVIDRVEFLQGDVLMPLVLRGITVDLVLANPPYVPSSDVDGLERDVKLYEPRLALDGGPHGTDVIEKLLAETPRVLLPGGFLVIEIGADQASFCAAAVESSRKWEWWKVIRDYAGFERVFAAKARA